ncbi:enoyl-CoA hydratase [Chromatiales bacterium (ex Bugula neritina AB1)]|nr:enoyl-CoA hydratase [Chromatiales bacterium (ex Bugula neritina AB1)]
MTNEVTTEIRDRVMIITLNRPDAMNAVNQALSNELAAALDQLDNEASVSVGVLTGNGRGFCAGMDLKEYVSTGLPTVPGRGFGGIVEKGSRKPLISAVEGFALAGGLELALGTDLIVAAKGAKFGIPEVSVGLFAAAGALLRLPRALPYARAMKMALTAEPMLAEEAYQFGLVAELCEKGEALNTAIDLANRIAKNAPLGLIASKELVREMQGRTEAEFWEFQATQVEQVFNSADGKEGATAFAEKRAPNWTGS